MFFHLRELEHHPIRFDVGYQPGELNLGDDLRQEGELRAEGQTELLRNTLGELRIRGRLRAAVLGTCDRCLEVARLPVETGFDLFYRPAPEAGTQHPEVRIAEGEEEIGFYEGDGVELKEVLREFVLLQVPMQLLCRPDCRGLCPECGANRNEIVCSCAAPKPDDRWSALNRLK